MHRAGINASDAWSVTTGVAGVTVALIDTGVWGDHPALESKLVAGWNIYDHSCSTTDVTGHGIRAAGVIAPTSDNSGIVGVCWSYTTMPVRFLDSDIASSVTWAPEHGAKIANLGYAATNRAVVSSAAQYIWSKGGITVTLSGNHGTFDSSGNPYILTVSGVNKATVSPSTATGTVTFLDGATTIGGTVLSGGNASFATSRVAVGSHSITASYGGDTNDSGSTSRTLTQTVQTVGKSSTSTTLTSSLNPSALRQTVTFTATVSPSSATGTVTFLYGTSTLGTSTVSGGKATFATCSLAAGTHSITASYSGDSNDNSSTSGAASQTVNKTGTTVAVTSSLNPSTSGQSVSFTATVSPASATGMVTFYDGTVSLGALRLDDSTATLSTSRLTAGNHTITATYGGNRKNKSSTSGKMIQAVNLTSLGWPKESDIDLWLFRIFVVVSGAISGRRLWNLMVDELRGGGKRTPRSTEFEASHWRTRISRAGAPPTEAEIKQPDAWLRAQTVNPASAPPPTINSFAAAPSSVNQGQSTTLYWSVSGATTISINNGVGTVTGSSVTVSPSQTTTYTLTALGVGGSVSAQAIVTVVTAPTGEPIITSAPSAVAIGQTITFEGSGFLSRNMVCFSPSSGTTTPFGLAVRSFDGVTLTFIAPRRASLVPGAYTLNVANASGASNAVTITIRLAARSAQR
ncbi:MAG: Ig-like domain repeat protein [Bryobacteraceae bacterium]